jgi:hypothetical protein
MIVDRVGAKADRRVRRGLAMLAARKGKMLVIGE